MCISYYPSTLFPKADIYSYQAKANLLSSDSESEFGVTVVDAAKRRKRGRPRKRKYSESGSEFSVRVSSHQSNTSYSRYTVKKSRKIKKMKKGDKRSEEISIADLVDLYGKRKAPKHPSRDKKEAKPKTATFYGSSSEDEIEKFENNIEDLDTTSYLCEERPNKITEIVESDQENEIKLSDGKASTLSLVLTSFGF